MVSAGKVTTMKMIAVTVAVAAVLGLARLAYGDDVFPPTWRGGYRTVFAEWDSFIQDGTTIPPDSWSASPGGVSAPNAWLSGDAEYYEAYLGHSGVLSLHGAPSWPQGSIETLFENHDLGGTSVDVRIQVTYLPPVYGEFYFSFNVQGPDWAHAYGTSPGPSPIATTMPDSNGWVTSVYEFHDISEGHGLPLSETIALRQYSGTGFVDQLVIDTRVVPEPGTCSLLALGGLALLRRRRGASS